MEKDWVIVKVFSKLYLAEIAVQVLADNNIEAVILNKQDSSYLSFGYIEVYVKSENVVKAKYYLKDL
jgi:hypothetical protein